MLIDWFTVGAQVLNFVLLVWLMKHFLYGPILKVVETRDARVAKELADAKQKQLEAGEERDRFEQKNADFQTQRDGMLQKAKEAADAEGQRLLAAAREAADAASNKYEQGLQREAEGLQRAIALRAQQEVFAIARKTLADLASSNLEARIGDAFLVRVQELNQEQTSAMGKALQASDQATVRTAFDLPTEQRDAIQKTLNETFSMEVPLRFETNPELVCGVELTANGQKVAWSIAEYLQSLATGVHELVETQRSKEPKAEKAQEVAVVDAN